MPFASFVTVEAVMRAVTEIYAMNNVGLSVGSAAGLHSACVSICRDERQQQISEQHISQERGHRKDSRRNVV